MKGMAAGGDPGRFTLSARFATAHPSIAQLVIVTWIPGSKPPVEELYFVYFRGILPPGE